MWADANLPEQFRIISKLKHFTYDIFLQIININQEQQGPQDRALSDPTADFFPRKLNTFNADSLSSFT